MVHYDVVMWSKRIYKFNGKLIGYNEWKKNKTNNSINKKDREQKFFYRFLINALSNIFHCSLLKKIKMNAHFILPIGVKFFSFRPKHFLCMDIQRHFQLKIKRKLHVEKIQCDKTVELFQTF